MTSRTKFAVLSTLVLLVVVLALSPVALAQETAVQTDSTSVRHFFDTKTDRVPFRTAFPEYPRIARRDRIEGEATVCFMIKADGKISKARVRSSTHRMFSRPSLRAIKKSSFEPLAPGQILGTEKTCRTYRFRLDPVEPGDDTG